jgi:tight adherence protein B
MDRSPDSQPVESVLRSDSGTFPLLRRFASGNSWSEGAARDLAQAGWGLKVSEYLLIRLVTAGAFGVVVALIVGTSGFKLLLAVLVGAAGFMLPAIVLYYFRARRQNAITKQLAETLALISNALRSGFAFTQAVELATKQLSPPISEELAQFLHDVSLGASTDVALQQMADRTGSYDLDMMVATIVIQRSTGGNLSEILDTVAETVRERERLQGEIRALTASQRFTGLVLSLYPVMLVAIFFALAPNTWKVLVTEELGRFLLAVAAVFQLLGMVTIRRILRLEV